jgi:hypothetical protein
VREQGPSLFLLPQDLAIAQGSFSFGKLESSPVLAQLEDDLVRANQQACEDTLEHLTPCETKALLATTATRSRQKLKTYSSYGPFEKLLSFNVAGSNLLTFTAYDRHGTPFKCLLDSGSTHDWADTSFAER